MLSNHQPQNYIQILIRCRNHSKGCLKQKFRIPSFKVFRPKFRYSASGRRECHLGASLNATWTSARRQDPALIPRGVAHGRLGGLAESKAWQRPASFTGATLASRISHVLVGCAPPPFCVLVSLSLPFLTPTAPRHSLCDVRTNSARDLLCFFRSVRVF